MAGTARAPANRRGHRSPAQMAPTTARWSATAQCRMPVAEVRVGEVVWVREGESAPRGRRGDRRPGQRGRKPADRRKRPGQQGRGQPGVRRHPQSGACVRLRATGVGADTNWPPSSARVGEAQGSKAPIQRLADVISGYFVPAVLAIAVWPPCWSGGASSGDWERASCRRWRCW